ncbi:hypothetical protein PENNAL_c0722G11228, partial [Penicillium nalgiovense]
WMLDSGCSAHMTPCKSVFHKYTTHKLPIHLATGEVFYAEGYGEVIIDLATFDGDQSPSGHDQSLYDHEASRAVTTFYKDYAEIKAVSTGEIKAYATMQNNQYWLHTYNGSIAHLCRLARVKKTQDHVEGLQIKKGTVLTRPCAPCVQGKGHALPFGKNKSIRTKPGDLIHIDIWGPCSIASYGGYNYYVTFTDDASRFCWVFLLKHKSELLDKFIQIEQWLQTQLNLTIKRVAGDNAGEHEPLRDYLLSKGKVWDPVPPYCPRLNGIPEVKNKHLVEPLVSIMSEHEIPKYLW